MSPTETPVVDASMAARSPAPPAPITMTSCSCWEKSIVNSPSSFVLSGHAPAIRPLVDGCVLWPAPDGSEVGIESLGQRLEDWLERFNLCFGQQLSLVSPAKPMSSFVQ